MQALKDLDQLGVLYNENINAGIVVLMGGDDSMSQRRLNTSYIQAKAE